MLKYDSIHVGHISFIINRALKTCGARVKDPDSCCEAGSDNFWVRDPDSVAHYRKKFVKSSVMITSYFTDTTISNC
jgi:hypothetical protein